MKKESLLFLVLLLVFCSNIPAFASPDLPNLREKPIALEQEIHGGYFLWQDQEGMHLWVWPAGVTHTFSGMIRTDGRFDNVLGKYQNESASCFTVNKSQNKILYNFTTDKEKGRIDFQLAYGSFIKFSLSIDGEPAMPEQIFIGKEGGHPATHEFTFRQEEEHFKYSAGQTIIIVGNGFWRH